MKKYRVRLKNNSWLSFDEETGEIKLPEHFGVDLMYNNDLSKEQIKIAHKRAEENDIKLLQEENNRLNNIIDEFDKWLIGEKMMFYKSDDGERLIRFGETKNKWLELKGDNK